jgi:hypothetical protein
MNKIEIVTKIGVLLKKDGWEIKWNDAPKSKEFFGWSITKKNPRQLKAIWIGQINHPKVKASGIFVAVIPVNSQKVPLLFDEGFKLLTGWYRDWWFVKQLISDRNLNRLKKEKIPNEISKTIRILLENTYPFSN